MDRSLYSDLHKDVYGFRPRGSEYHHIMEVISDEDFAKEWDFLIRQLEINEREEDRMNSIQLQHLQAHLMGLCFEHDIPLATAIAWDKESMNDIYTVDDYYWLHLHGITRHKQLTEFSEWRG